MNKDEMDQFLISIGGLNYTINDNKKIITNSKFFAVKEGRYQMIKELITELINLGWDKEIYCVKEKFGGLRFYINNGNEKIFNKIVEFESKSHTICEITGKSGKSRLINGWYYTLCDEEYEKKLVEQIKIELNKNKNDE